MVKSSIEMDRSDLATFLGALIAKLHADSWALTGLAESHFQSGRDYDAMHSLAGSMGKTAALVAGVKTHLCRDCQLMGISEHVVLTPKETAPRKRPKHRKVAR